MQQDKHHVDRAAALNERFAGGYVLPRPVLDQPFDVGIAQLSKEE